MADACVSNAGYITAAWSQADAIVEEAAVNAAIAAALALWQRRSSEAIANMQEEIAKRQVSLAEKLHDHAKQFWAEEKEYVDDAFNNPKKTENYFGTADGWKELTQRALSEGRFMWLTQMRAQCLPPSRCDDARWKRFGGLFTADSMSFAARQEEIRTQALNDQRYAQQYAALAMGKGILGDSLSFQNAAGSSGLAAGGALAGLINTAAGALGFAFAYRAPKEWSVGPDWGQPVSTAPGYESNKLKMEPIPVPQAPARQQIEQDPCGPMPGSTATEAEWRRWSECKNFK